VSTLRGRNSEEHLLLLDLKGVLGELLALSQEQSNEDCLERAQGLVDQLSRARLTELRKQSTSALLGDCLVLICRAIRIILDRDGIPGCLFEHLDPNVAWPFEVRLKAIEYQLKQLEVDPDLSLANRYFIGFTVDLLSVGLKMEGNRIPEEFLLRVLEVVASLVMLAGVLDILLCEGV